MPRECRGAGDCNFLYIFMLQNMLQYLFCLLINLLLYFQILGVYFLIFSDSTYSVLFGELNLDSLQVIDNAIFVASFDSNK